MAAMPEKECLTFNVGSGKTYSVNDVVQLFREILGREITVEVDQSRVRPVDRPVLHSNISKFTKATDWRPSISLREGLTRLLKEEGVLEK